jgi:hypothetical protein
MSTKKKKRHRRAVHAALSRKRGIGFSIGSKFFGEARRTGGPGSGIPPSFGGPNLLGRDGAVLTDVHGVFLTGV